MDKIEKALKKLSDAERSRVKKSLVKLRSGSNAGLDIKKLKGRGDIFRLRTGDLRLIYRVDHDEIFLLAISRRNEKTYKEI